MVSDWPDGVERLVADEVTSTNDVVAELATSGRGPLWLLAHSQTGSRGRRGRAWSFQRGNFAASYLLWPTKPQSDFAQMSFVAALALFEAVKSFAPESDLYLKWPNDVLLGGKKLSGILLETVQVAGKNGLVIGIGVNLCHAPDQSLLEDHALPAATLADHTQSATDPEEFLDRLATQLDHWERRWNDHGFAPIRDAWLTRAMGLGNPVTARLMNQEITGVFEDIDGDGSLVLRSRNERVVLPAGDIFFGTPDHSRND